MIDLKQNSLYLGSAAPTSGGGGGGGGSSFKMPLFTSHFYDINPNTADDSSWVESDGEWVSGADYPEAYAMLVSEYDNPGSTTMGELSQRFLNYGVKNSLQLNGTIASNFDYSNYISIGYDLTADKIASFNNASSWVYQIKIKVDQTSIFYAPFFSDYTYGDNYRQLEAYYDIGSKRLWAYFSSDYYHQNSQNKWAYTLSTDAGVLDLTQGAYYYFRFGFDGTNVYMSYSLDGSTFTILAQQTIDPNIKPSVWTNTAYPSIGRRGTVSYLCDNSEVDLSGCYIKTDNSLQTSLIKVSELIEIKIEDVNLDDAYLICGGNKTRVVPMGTIAARAVRDYLQYMEKTGMAAIKHNDLLFINVGGSKLSRQGFWKIVKYYKDKAKIKKDITPNTLRHSFAVLLMENGADVASVQEMLGHKAVISTKVYADMVSKRINEVYKKAHPRA